MNKRAAMQPQKTYEWKTKTQAQLEAETTKELS